MKKIFDYTIAIVACAFMMCLAQTMDAKQDNQPKELKVMSYNVRTGTANDGTNSWQFRCPATIEMLNEQKPDVFGIQEALESQLLFITENIKDYKQVGVGRDNGKKKGEFMSIFWNTKTVSMIKWGTFWLSETPDVPSKGWDAACKRTATWALMKDKKTGKKYYFVNTHLDHKGTQAQKNGLALIVSKIKEMNPKGYPMVLTGDFNIKPDDPALVDLDKIMVSARNVALTTDHLQTFNGWGKAKSDLVIDYIYISGFSRCIEYQTVTKKYADRKYISDHYPIYATLIF
jgi:endonuclease/exonuclease/phosphatase family metal-dependent hydrolase